MITIAHINARHPLPASTGIRVRTLNASQIESIGQKVDIIVVEVKGLTEHMCQKAFDNPHSLPSLALVGDQEEANKALENGATDYILITTLTPRTFQHRLKRLMVGDVPIRRIIQSNPDGILVLDDSGIIIFANTAAKTLFQRQNLVGTLFGYPIVGETSTELNIVTRDGTPRVVEMRTTPAPWGDQMATIAALRDITDRIEMQEAAEEARLRAESANGAKDVFLMAVSHELRTPLTAITGFADTLLADDVSWSTEEWEEFVGIMRDEATKLHNLIDEVLRTSQSDDTLLTVKKEVTSLQTIMDTSLIQLGILTSNHTFEVNISPDLPSIHADPYRLSQVITNLVENAAKYAPPDTLIRLEAVQADDEFILFTVTDNGPGIPPAEWQTIFKPLARTQQVERIEGLGLGLTIARDILNQHGGSIWVEDSSPDQGTTIAVRLPIAHQT